MNERMDEQIFHLGRITPEAAILDEEEIYWQWLKKFRIRFLHLWASIWRHDTTVNGGTRTLKYGRCFWMHSADENLGGKVTPFGSFVLSLSLCMAVCVCVSLFY